MNPKHYLTIVKASAWYDLLVTSVFATPWTFAAVYGTLQSLAHTLNLPGQIPNLTVTDILFANLLGTVVVVWSVVRLRQPSVALGRYDAFGRLFFTIWQLYAVCTGASWVLLGFVVFEALFGVLQALPVQKS